MTINTEKVTSHLYLTEEKSFNPSNPSTMNSFVRQKLPQALEMVNQTVSIPSEPEKKRFFSRNLLEFEMPTDEHI